MSPLLFILFLYLETCLGLNEDGSIEVVWDITSYTTDGYEAIVSIKNNELERSIQAPGWELSWSWYNEEIIWSIAGAKATKQGDCSGFEDTDVPLCCLNNPTIVDLSVPRDDLIVNCCKGGVITAGSSASFQVTVGRVGTEVFPPQNLAFIAPGSKYICDSFSQTMTSHGSASFIIGLESSGTFRRSVAAFGRKSACVQPTVGTIVDRWFCNRTWGSARQICYAIVGREWVELGMMLPGRTVRSPLRVGRLCGVCEMWDNRGTMHPGSASPLCCVYVRSV
ncbi:unnamed protein product [Microthlaspi erraticum]|uniref:COBRA-like protein n=1 Tax=Microthlaspi erraticum TaxID=1685480 RepID=A0A6D2J9J9_9BRAS|nr:unnamed protein product [Microthlaspi erraticum]